MLLLVKSCSFSQKYDKKSYRISFLSRPTVYFLPFILGMSPQKVCQNYLGTKTTSKAAQKHTPSQFCSKKALNEAIFRKNGNFGTHAIAVSFLSCFSLETQLSF